MTNPKKMNQPKENLLLFVKRKIPLRIPEVN